MKQFPTVVMVDTARLSEKLALMKSKERRYL